jgi:type IV pilus biogenesis protein CpaD/CtpE
MTKLLVVAVFVVAAILLVGCADGDKSTVTTITTPIPTNWDVLVAPQLESGKTAIQTQIDTGKALVDEFNADLTKAVAPVVTGAFIVTSGGDAAKAAQMQDCLSRGGSFANGVCK